MQTLERAETVETRKALLTEVSKPRDALSVRVWSVVAIALVACVAVAHGWRKGYVLAPTDALQLVAPWNKGEPYIARNEQLLDQTVQFVPWTLYTVNAYKHGQIPLWNPHSQLGAPFMANGQSAIFYPTILLHWHLPAEWSWTISAALRLFLAGLGTYLLAGRYGLRGLPRLLAAVAFMLCGFNVVWLNHPQTNVMPWLPWGVLVVELLIERVTFWRVLGGTTVFAVQFLGGHPATCIHLLLTCGMVWVLRVAMPIGRAPRAGRLKGVIGSGIAFGVCVAFAFALAAAQWLPLIEYANNSGATILRAEKLANASWFELDPRYLIGLCFPYANGFPDGIAPFDMRRVTRLPNTNELAPGFVGTIPLVLGLYAAVALRRHRVVLTWIIVGLVAAAIAIKLPVVTWVVWKVKGLNVAQNARLLAVTALALAILAGFGLEALTTSLRAGVDPARLRKWLTRIAIGVAAIAVVGALSLWLAKNPILNKGYAQVEQAYKAEAKHENTLEHVRSLVPRIHTELVLTCVRLLIPAAMLGVLVFVLRQRPFGHAAKRVGAVLLVFATVDLLAFAIPYNPGAPAETMFPTNVPALAKLQELPPARVAGTYRTLFPETSTAYALSDVRGYDALAPARYYKWWDHEGIGDLSPAMQGYPARMENPEHPAWSLLNFGYLLVGPNHDGPSADQFKLLHRGDDATIYQPLTVRPRAWVVPRAEVYDTIDPVLDRVAGMDFDPAQVVLLDRDVAPDGRPLIDAKTFANAGSASTVRKPTVELIPPTRPDDDRPELLRLRVTGAQGGYLVLADTYFPGWTATVVDERTTVGKEVPILPAYGALRAIPLPTPAAANTPLRVEFRYRPWSWRIGAAVTMTALCLYLLLLGAALCTTQRATDGKP